MPTSGGAYIPITASRKQISREIKQLMGNGGKTGSISYCPKSWNQKKKKKRQEEPNVHNWPGFNHTGAKCFFWGNWKWGS